MVSGIYGTYFGCIKVVYIIYIYEILNKIHITVISILFLFNFQINIILFLTNFFLKKIDLILNGLTNFDTILIEKKRKKKLFDSEN